jgi:hypothetical protein
MRTELSNTFFVLAVILAEVVTLSDSALGAQPALDLLSEAREGNRAAIEAIETLNCTVTMSYSPSDSPPYKSATFSFEYWRSRSGIRSRYNNLFGVVDEVLRDSRHCSLNTSRASQGGSTPAYANVTADAGGALGPHDAFCQGLLLLQGVGAKRAMTFDDLLNLHPELETAERRTEHGIDYIVVQLKLVLNRQQLWFQPSANYLIQRQILTYKNNFGPQPQEERTENVVTKFIEVQPGVFFPERVRCNYAYHRGVFGGTREAAFSHVKINAPLPATTFDLQFPAGTHVSDRTKGKQYVADAHGQPVEVPPLTQTGEEPPSWIDWILFGGAGILAMAMAVRGWRTFRPARRSTR